MDKQSTPSKGKAADEEFDLKDAVLGEKGARRRQEIVALAASSVLKDGVGRLSLRDVASRLGITHSNLQYYFPKKTDLLLAIFDEALKRYTDGLLLAVIHANSPEERVRAIISSGLVALAQPETSLWRMAISMSDHDTQMAHILRTENAIYRDVVAEQIGAAWPKTTQDQRAKISRTIQALMDGTAIQQSLEDWSEAQTLALEPIYTRSILALVDQSGGQG